LLAWNRTALAMGVNALLVVRAGLQPDARVMLLPALLLVVFSIAFVAAGAARRSQLAEGGEATPPTAMLASAAAAVMLAAVFELWLVVRWMR